MTISTPPALAHGALIIAGPTGVGKSELAVEVAERCGGEIVGADAFQIYAGLDLLTAKPAPELRARVPHHLIGEIPLTQTFNVARFLELASARMAEIRARGGVPVVVGGTGLYVRALIRGLSELPAGDPSLRAELEHAPLPELQERLRELDPAACAWIDLQNPRRLVRALEVCIASGKPYSSFRAEWRAAPPRRVGVVLTRERDDLYARIDQRVEEMFRDGVVEEVRSAGEVASTAAQTLGLREIQAFIRGEMSQRECIAAIQQATRRYAKRQMTWFRKEAGLVETRIGPSVIETLLAMR